MEYVSSDMWRKGISLMNRPQVRQRRLQIVVGEIQARTGRAGAYVHPSRRARELIFRLSAMDLMDILDTLDLLDSLAPLDPMESLMSPAFSRPFPSGIMAPGARRSTKDSSIEELRGAFRFC